MRTLRLSENLKACREERGMSCAQLGSAVGVAREQIWCYEHGEKLPSIQTFAMICGVLGVTADALLFGEVGA